MDNFDDSSMHDRGYSEKAEQETQQCHNKFKPTTQIVRIQGEETEPRNEAHLHG